MFENIFDFQASSLPYHRKRVTIFIGMEHHRLHDKKIKKFKKKKKGAADVVKKDLFMIHSESPAVQPLGCLRGATKAQRK